MGIVWGKRGDKEILLINTHYLYDCMQNMKKGWKTLLQCLRETDENLGGRNVLSMPLRRESDNPAPRTIIKQAAMILAERGLVDALYDCDIAGSYRQKCFELCMQTAEIKSDTKVIAKCCIALRDWKKAWLLLQQFKDECLRELLETTLPEDAAKSLLFNMLVLDAIKLQCE